MTEQSRLNNLIETKTGTKEENDDSQLSFGKVVAILAMMLAVVVISIFFLEKTGLF